MQIYTLLIAHKTVVSVSYAALSNRLQFVYENKYTDNKLRECIKFV